MTFWSPALFGLPDDKEPRLSGICLGDWEVLGQGKVPRRALPGLRVASAATIWAHGPDRPEALNSDLGGRPRLAAQSADA